MNKLLAALIAGFFAVSVNAAFAADEPAAPAAGASMEKPAAPAPKKGHMRTHKKAHKMESMKKDEMKKEEKK